MLIFRFFYFALLRFTRPVNTPLLGKRHCEVFYISKQTFCLPHSTKANFKLAYLFSSYIGPYSSSTQKLRSALTFYSFYFTLLKFTKPVNVPPSGKKQVVFNFLSYKYLCHWGTDRRSPLVFAFFYLCSV